MKRKDTGVTVTEVAGRRSEGQFVDSLSLCLCFGTDFTDQTKTDVNQLLFMKNQSEKQRDHNPNS